MIDSNTITRRVLNLFGIILVLTTAAWIGGLTGCAGNGHTQSSSDSADEQADSARVRRAFDLDTQYKYGGVTVQTTKGAIRLSGVVDSNGQKIRAGEIAKGVAGDRQVENYIVVRESPKSP